MQLYFSVFTKFIIAFFTPFLPTRLLLYLLKKVSDVTYKDLEKHRKVTYEEGLRFSTKYPEMIFREVNSFIKKGALQESYYELLRLIYDKIEIEKKQIFREGKTSIVQKS